MLRRIVSLTALFTFVLTLVTSLILYITPQGRIAYWADWKLLGLDKSQWGNLHINLGTLFLLALVFHLFYNWKPVLAYLSRARRVVFFTRESALALALTGLVGLGTYFAIPPFSSFLDLSTAIKDAAARKYGEPPYGHAELSSLATLAGKLGMTAQQVLEALAKAGFPAESGEQTLLELSRRYGVPPRLLYGAFAPSPAPATGLPATPPAGTGSLPLADLCARFDLKIPEVLGALEARGIRARADLNLRQIGEANAKTPQDIYASIREAVSARAN